MTKLRMRASTRHALSYAANALQDNSCLARLVAPVTIRHFATLHYALWVQSISYKHVRAGHNVQGGAADGPGHCGGRRAARAHPAAHGSAAHHGEEPRLLPAQPLAVRTLNAFLCNPIYMCVTYIYIYIYI